MVLLQIEISKKYVCMIGLRSLNDLLMRWKKPSVLHFLLSVITWDSELNFLD